MGLLSSLHLLGRKNDLHIYHPPGLRQIIELQLELSGTVLNYKIFWNEHSMEKPGVIFEDQLLTVETIPLYHRIACCGFIFREKPRPYSIDKEEVVRYGVPRYQMTRLKNGEDAVLDDGTVIPNAKLTRGRQKSRSYAFCSDTRFDRRVIEAVRGVDLLYHEATFMHELVERAIKTYHTTAKEAGTVAREAGVGRLVIGHYSVRYMTLQPLLDEARQEFPETALAEEGSKFSIPEQFVVKK
jgi:ribonuclease Z